MFRTVQLVLAGVLVLLFGMAVLSRRFPDVAWLQAFRYTMPRLSEEQRAKVRQRSNIHAGIELILIGLVVPIAYVIGTVMLFNEPTTTGIVLALAGSALLIALGVTAIWRNRRR